MVTDPGRNRQRCLERRQMSCRRNHVEFGTSDALSEGLRIDQRSLFVELADQYQRGHGELLEASAHVVGLSMGGMVALQLALRHPGVVRSLVLVDTSPAFGLDGTDPDEWQAARLAPLLAGAQIEDFAEPVLRGVMAPDPDPAAVALAVQSMLRVPIAGLMQTIAALPAHDVRARLREISAPTLVLVGELDEETPLAYAQALAEGIAGAELHVIPAAGHLTPFEAPLAVAALIGDHLQRMESH